METIINNFIYLLATIPFLLNCGCYSINDKSLSDSKLEDPLQLEIKLSREVNLIYIEGKALRTSRDHTKRTNEFKKELSKEFKDKSNWKHYLSICRPIYFTITNTSSQPVYFFWRYAKIEIKLVNDESGENITCQYLKNTEKTLFGHLGHFQPEVILTSLEPGEYMIGCLNPSDYNGFPNPKNYNDMKDTPWDLTIEIEFFSFPFYDVDIFSGKLKSNVDKVIVYPSSFETLL